MRDSIYRAAAALAAVMAMAGMASADETTTSSAAEPASAIGPMDAGTNLKAAPSAKNGEGDPVREEDRPKQVELPAKTIETSTSDDRAIGVPLTGPDPDLALTPDITEFEGFEDHGTPIESEGAEREGSPPLVESGDDNEFAGKSVEFLEMEYSACTMQGMSARSQMSYITTQFGDDPSGWTPEQQANYESYAGQAAMAENYCRRLEARLTELKGAPPGSE